MVWNFHSATIDLENILFHDVLEYDSVTVTLEIIKTDGLFECRIIIVQNVFQYTILITLKMKN